MNLGIFKRSKEIIINSPLKGEIKRVEDAPHEVFTSNVIGDGCAIEPADGIIHAPVSSKVEIFKTNHLLIFEPKKGVYVVIHFGVGTSPLKGEGFKRLPKGELKEVAAGDELVSCDLEFIASKAKSLMTPIIVSNDNIESLELLVKPGDLVEVGTPLMKVKVK